MKESFTVLYIDDDAIAGRLVSRMLTRHGFEVQHHADAESGLKQLHSDHFDAVLLDHDLGTTTGIAVLNELSVLEPAAPPAVYLTASSELSIAVEALKAGAIDYVVKTIGEDFEVLLVTAIRKSLEKSVLRKEKERAEAEVREGRDRAIMLLAEVNHRVGNSLALIGSLVRLQMRSDNDPKIRAALSEVEARIGAVASLHRSLYTSDDVRLVELKPYLQSLVDALASTIEGGESSRMKFTADPISVPTDSAVSIGVIATELVTNAIKYAYQDQQVGEIRVTLVHRGADDTVLTVEDDGVGWNGQGPVKGTGLGSKVIGAMAKSLNAELVYEPRPQGTRAVIAFRVPAPRG